MYRILSASKDTYITNKYIGTKRRSNTNVGQAGSIDLFSLYDETVISNVTGTIREISRGLIQFDYSEIESMVSNGTIDISDESFKCFLNLKDIYGGQTTPSNFTISLFPVSKSWDEGRGMDVVRFQDVDSCNFITASITNGNITLWDEEGANKSGSLGESDIDIISSGNIGNGNQSLEKTQNFLRGDEDLLIDITDIVSASIVGMLENNGFRISFSSIEENNENTYFVKRFGTRHTNDKSLRPRLIVKGDTQLVDDTGIPQFNVSQSFFVYNESIGESGYENFSSGSSQVTGNDCIILELAASRSVSFLTTSWSTSHSASITYTTRSLSYFSQSFTGSQYSSKTGIYYADVYLDSISDGNLKDFLSGSKEQTFKSTWKSLDGSINYATNFLKFKTHYGQFSNAQERNWVVNITNMKSSYVSTEIARLRVFVQDYNIEQIATRVPTKTQSTIVKNMLWRLRNAFTKKEYIPFDETCNKLSCDSDGMYFDLYIKDLDIGEVYQIDLMIKSETGKDFYIENDGFRFKVIK